MAIFSKRSLQSMRKVVMGTPAVYSSSLIKELLELEKVDRHWEIAFRRRYLASKEDELRAIEKSFKFHISQWEIGAMIWGAFMLHCLYGLLTLSPLAVVISVFGISLLTQLRMHRDKLTLYYTLVSLGAYIILLVNLIVVHPEHRVNYGSIITIFGLAFIHAIILAVLGRHSIGQHFERFADSCLQFRVPSLLEVQSMFFGVIIFLGICFSTVKLHYLSYTGFIVFLFTVIARAGIKVRRSRHREQNANFLEASLPVVRSLMSVMFTAAALCICIASLFNNHVLSITNQESFKAWERSHGHSGEYTTAVKGLAYIFTISCAFILVVNVLLLLKLMMGSLVLSHALEHSTLFMGKAALGHKKNIRYEYHTYTLDRNGRVMGIETIRKSPINGYNKPNMTCYDIYLAMQKKALHALNHTSLYCFVPIGPLYSTERDTNPLVRGRVSLERMADRLDMAVAGERKRRRDDRRRRERVKRLTDVSLNRPSFISSSIPAGVGLPVAELPRDTLRETCDEIRSHKRSMSIPAELSLCAVDELPVISRHMEKLYKRRCVTTAISDDFYWRKRGIIDRVRTSWLEQETPESLPSFEVLKPTNACVYRDPQNGDFNFNKIDKELSNIFRGLEIMNGYDTATDIGPILDRLKHGRYEPRNTAVHNVITFDIQDEGATPGVTIDIGDDTPVQRLTPSHQDTLMGSSRSGARYSQCTTPAALSEMVSQVHPDGINIDVPQPVQYIDIGTAKSVYHESEWFSPEGKLLDASSPLRSLDKWHWLDSALNDAVDVNTRSVDRNTESYNEDPVEHRMRPIEEVLEGEYYINQNGQLVVKNDDNRYVPVRYKGVRNVRNLAKYFDSRFSRMHADANRGESDSDITPKRRDVAKVVTSPVHKMMMLNTGSNDVYVEHRANIASQQMLLADAIDVHKVAMEIASPSNDAFVDAISSREAIQTGRTNVTITREYENHKPFELVNVAESYSARQQSVDCTPEQVVAEQPSSGTGDAKEVSIAEDIATEAQEGTHREMSVGSSKASMDTVKQLTPRSLRRLAAARHLPLALDSRHEKIYSVCPQPRRDGAVVSVDAINTPNRGSNTGGTPLSAKGRGDKFEGSSGCDFGDPELYSAIESVASPTSLRSRSPALSPSQQVTPRRNWRNEFDFSPIAVHSGMDVLMELMQDMAIDESGAEDQSSDVSHDFIFGR
ncbi:eamA-like transporter family protein, putative [Babesia ovis]|uniref:EamA-like transporter family protein, putative n=1 Tax=Babesia ovis TaxID=5869 RepID=A0A9W5WTI7_BABOV|nr:eamA-like transporter family protein, putative [Babesia ovis]